MAINTTIHEIEVEDREYVRHGDTPLLARLFKPRGRGPFPIMVEVHGGAWVNGNRLNGEEANKALAKTGVIVVALDFRVPPEAPYPTSLADIHYGIRWCKTHAEEWNGQAVRIGAMGTSSGAHQAMLLGIQHQNSMYGALLSPPSSVLVDAVLGCIILCSPVIDPLGRYHYAKGLRGDCTPPEGFAERVVPMHNQYWQTEEAMAEGDPLRILDRGDYITLPPVFLLARMYEESHPLPDREKFIKKYTEAGGHLDVTIFEGTNDGLFSDPSSSIAKKALQQMRSFINEHIE